MRYGKHKLRTVLSVAALAWAFSFGAFAQDYDKKEFKEAFPEKELPFVGDYVGRWNEIEKINPEVAAQVFAQGGDKYRIRITARLDMRAPIQLDIIAKAKRGKINFKEGDFYGEISKNGTFTGGRGKEHVFTMEKTKRSSKYMHLRPPEGAEAEVLYDGNGFGAWQDDFEGWVELDKGVMMVTPDGGYLISKNTYTDLTLHVEFRLSHMPKARGQQRSNSGVFISDEYEIQVLDSYGLDGLFNECGAVYKTSAPRVNATFPPLQWQTYDITFINAKYDDAGKLIANPRVTVWHNEVLIHSDEELPWVPGYSAEDRSEAHHREPGHIRLQGHHNFVQYRNVWVRDDRK